MTALDTQALINAGRSLSTPFEVASPDAEAFQMLDVFRLLPGRRITGRAQLPHQSTAVLAKIFLDRDSKARAEAEASGLRKLAAAGIASPRLLGQVAVAGGGQAVLTEFLSDSQTLSDRLGRGLCLMAQTEARPRLSDVARWLDQAICLLATLHRASLIHTDPHLGNLLFQNETIFLLDGDAVSSNQSKTLFEKNLAGFLGGLSPDLSPFIPGLLQTYNRLHRDLIDLKQQTEIDRLNHDIRIIQQERCEDFLQKTVRDCSLFAVSETGLKFTACARHHLPWLSELLHQPDAFMTHSIKAGNTCTIAQTSLNDQPLVIKRYNIKGLGHFISRFWRPTRAWHSWRSAHRLQFWGIKSPEPIALIEERLGPFRKRAWFVSRQALGPDMASHLKAFAPELPPEKERAQLKKLFERLVEEQISHGDMKANNFIWSEDDWLLIDLDSLAFHPQKTAFLRAYRQDLDRFLKNWTDYPVFKNWCQENLPKAEANPSRRALTQQ